MKKILIVEDGQKWSVQYQQDLGGYEVSLIIAERADEARRQFEVNPDVAAIVMDGCLFSEAPNTLELVKEFRVKGYTGPIIANSSDYNKELQEAGCDHTCKYDSKGFIPDQLIQLLDLKHK